MAKQEEVAKKQFPGNFICLTSKNGAAEYPLYIRYQDIINFTYYDGRSVVSYQVPYGQGGDIYVKESPEQVAAILKAHTQAVEEYYNTPRTTTSSALTPA